MRGLREVFSLFSFLLLFAGLWAIFYALRDARMGQGVDWYTAAFGVACVTPYLLAAALGRVLAADFLVSLVFGGSRAASHGYSRERALARAGQGHDAAVGFLLRDRIVGDRPGLWAVLEMARLDPSLAPEAVKAAARIIGAGRSNAADREHAGRLLQQVRASTARVSYPG